MENAACTLSEALTAGTRSDLTTRLREIFEWHAVSPLSRELRARFELNAFAQWEVFARAGRSAEALRLCDLASALSAETLRAVAAAPEFRHLIGHPRLAHASKLEFASMVLSYEHAANGGPRSFSASVWSVLGHGCATCLEGAIERGPTVYEWRPDRDHRAPELHGIQLDLFSPFGAVQVPDGLPLREQLRPPEAARATHKLEFALANVHAIAPAAFELMREQVRVICVRVDRRAETAVGSSTSWSRPGHVGLTNVHLDYATEARIANALVHEAMHCLMFLAAREQPFLPDLEDRRGCRGRSPWTGRELPVATLVQAVYVWYGLVHFWSRAALARVFESGSVRAVLNEAAAGFLAPGFDATLQLIVDLGLTELADSFLMMRARVRDSSAP
jgi:hypothetical protein